MGLALIAVVSAVAAYAVVACASVAVTAFAAHTVLVVRAFADTAVADSTVVAKGSTVAAAASYPYSYDPPAASKFVGGIAEDPHHHHKGWLRESDPPIQAT